LSVIHSAGFLPPKGSVTIALQMHQPLYIYIIVKILRNFCDMDSNKNIKEADKLMKKGKEA